VNMKRVALLLLISCTTPPVLRSQCPSCIGGAAVGGLTPVGGTVNVGVLREGFGRASAYYRFSSGNTTLAGSARAESGPVSSYRTHYLGLSLAYGISNRLTVESEIGYFPRKIQDFNGQTAAGSGLSHLMPAVKYNVCFDLAQEVEFTAGLGVRIPLLVQESDLPQHVLPSSGAYAAVPQLFLHKGWKRHGFRLILNHRSDFNAENRLAYRYGAAFITSLHAVKLLSGDLSGLLELRHEYRKADAFQGTLLTDTGGEIIAVAPQLNLVTGDLNISVVFDLPLYRYYNGCQLANDFSFALNLAWQSRISGD